MVRVDDRSNRTPVPSDYRDAHRTIRRSLIDDCDPESLPFEFGDNLRLITEETRE